MRFRQRVAIQAPQETRDSMGGSIVAAYETVLEDVPATVRAMADERRLDQMTPVEDRYEVMLAGVHSQVRPEMVVLDGTAVYDIDRVTYTEAGWPHPRTLIEARRVDV